MGPSDDGTDATLTGDPLPDPVIAHELRRWLPAKRVIRFGEGDFCTAYLVDDRTVVRIAKHTAAAAALQREFALLPELANQIDLEIPRPLFIGATSAGSVLVGHELVPGEPLTPEQIQTLGPDRCSRIVDGLRDFVQQLHAFDTSRAAHAGVALYDPRTEIEGRRGEIEARVWPLLTPAAREGCRIAFERLQERSDTRRVLTHNDLSPGHVLVDGAGRLSGVIDFGDMVLSEPDWDLRFLYEDFGAPFLTRFLANETHTRGRVRFELARAFSLWDSLVWIEDRLGPCDVEVSAALAQIEADASDERCNAI